MRRDRPPPVVPAGLKVNRQSAVPVHLQLKTQLRHLIATGALKPGSQLPTVRQLASILRINRNTVGRVLIELRHDGYLDSYQGRGTFVSDHQAIRESKKTQHLERLVEQALAQAKRLGVTPEEFLAAAGARAPLVAAKKATKTRALLVECNWEELRRYGEELEAELPLAVDRVLLDELAERYRTTPGFLRDYPLLLTTLFHLHEVRQTLARESIPVVGLLTELSASTFLRLAELPAGAAVGLVCTTPGGSQNLLRSIQSLGMSHLRLVTASTDDPWSIELALKETVALVCSEQAVDRLRAMVPPAAEAIGAQRNLHRGSVDLVRDLLERMG